MQKLFDFKSNLGYNMQKESAMTKFLFRMNLIVVAILLAVTCFASIPFASNISTTNVKAATDTQYTITYLEYENGSERTLSAEEIGSNPTTYTSADLPLNLSAPTQKTGYTFRGWHKILEESQLNYVIEIGTTGNIVLYADYSVNSYTITYLGLPEGTPLPEKQSYTYEEEVDFSTITPNIYGCNFEGWYTDAYFTTSAQNISLHSQGNVTVYAKYSDIMVTISFNEQFDDMVVKFGTSAYDFNGALLDKEPTKDGYTFGGWYTSEDFANYHKVDHRYSFTNDVTLYAKWDRSAGPIVKWLAIGFGALAILGFAGWLLFARPKLTDD